MPVKVSVVVPVFNPGASIEACIASLLRQTLPADEFEVVFVDDGSTDDTPARLAQLARDRPHVKVVTIPNSGWPGKPRNVGVEAARGEYVQFLDQDDHLASGALERLYAMGRRNGSDIVIGKVASNFRGVPHAVFKTDRETCTLRDAPLYDSLTPHKMFRTDFLREHGIAFPEGKRRLEDQLYMMQAYFAAEVVSILGRYTCYYYCRRTDGKNAGSAPIVPADYYANLREVLDVVVAHTEPGAFRDRLLRRFYRVEMLGRLSEPAVLRYSPDYLDQMCAAVEPLAEDFVGPGVHDGLGAVLRMRSTLLRTGDREALLGLARVAASIRANARLESFGWQPDGRVALTVSAELVRGEDGAPLVLRRLDGRYLLDLGDAPGPAQQSEDGVANDRSGAIDVTDDLDGFAAELSLRNRETGVEWPCPATFTTTVQDAGPEGVRVVLRGRGFVSADAVRGRGRISRGLWDVWVPFRGLGLVRKARLGHDRNPAVDGACRPAFLGFPARPVIPYFTDPGGNLTLDVAGRAKRLVTFLDARPVRRSPVPQTEVRLDLFTTRATATAPVRLELSRGAGTTSEPTRSEHTLPGLLRPVQGRTHLVLPRRADGVAPGPWLLGARIDGLQAPPLALGRLQVGRRGRIVFDRTVPKMASATTAREVVARGRSVATRVLRVGARRSAKRLRAARADSIRHGGRSRTGPVGLLGLFRRLGPTRRSSTRRR